jgi:hypothetical protein
VFGEVEPRQGIRRTQKRIVSPTGGSVRDIPAFAVDRRLDVARAAWSGLARSGRSVCPCCLSGAFLCGFLGAADGKHRINRERLAGEYSGT